MISYYCNADLTSIRSGETNISIPLTVHLVPGRYSNRSIYSNSWIICSSYSRFALFSFELIPLGRYQYWQSMEKKLSPSYTEEKVWLDQSKYKRTRNPVEVPRILFKLARFLVRLERLQIVVNREIWLIWGRILIISARIPRLGRFKFRQIYLVNTKKNFFCTQILGTGCVTISLVSIIVLAT